MGDKAREILEKAARRAARVQQTTSPEDGVSPRASEPNPPRKKQKKGNKEPPEADSDATTVPAPTPEARRMAQESFEQANKADKSQDGPENAEATQPAIPRRLQSEPVLGQKKPDQTTQTSSLNVKKSESTMSLANTKDKALAEPVKVESRKTTAVKAKAVPPKTEDNPTTTAVHECLARSSTAEIEQAAQRANESQPKGHSMTMAIEASKATNTQPSQPTPPPPTQPASENGSEMDNGGKEDQEDNKGKGNENKEDEESSASEDSEERRAKEEQLQAKKEARARYMRFHRSLSSKKTPKEIRAAGAAAHRDSPKLQLLMEQWTQCEGIWTKSDFWIQLKSKRRNRKFGCRKWMTKSELTLKYGSAQVAQEIIEAKMFKEDVRKEQVRAHPDCHGKDTEETRQYLIWDKEGEEDTVDETATTLFEAAEDPDRFGDTTCGRGRQRERSKSKSKVRKESKTKNKKSQKGKRKGRKSSSSSTDMSSSPSSESSSKSEEESSRSETPEVKKKKKDKGGKDKTKKSGKGKGKRGDKEKEKAKEKDKEKAEKEKEKEREKAEKEKEKDRERAEKEKERREKKEAEEAQKAAKKEAEEKRKKEEKAKNDAFKKEQRKGNQAITKLGAAISKAASLGDQLHKLSDTVVKAITTEVEPHLDDLRSCRSKLQQHIDVAKVDNYQDMMDSIEIALKTVENFQQFCQAYNIK